jgi:hypothetical protein
MQRKVYDERMELKDKELRAGLDRERAAAEQYAMLQNKYDRLE